MPQVHFPWDSSAPEGSLFGPGSRQQTRLVQSAPRLPEPRPRGSLTRLGRRPLLPGKTQLSSKATLGQVETSFVSALGKHVQVGHENL